MSCRLPRRTPVLAAFVLAGALAAQSTRPSSNPWFAGWLAETLDRDFVAARELYGKASADENLHVEHRLLATVRLAEFHLATGQNQALMNAFVRIGQLQRLRGQPPFPRETERAWEPLLALGGEFRETLALADDAERRARLAELRAKVRLFITDSKTPPEPRPWMQAVIRMLLQLAPAADARDAARPRTVVEYRKGARLRAAEVARLRLDGHVEQAKRLETLPIRQPGVRPRSLGVGNQQEVLARAIRKLNEALQRERRTDLYAVERATLERLRERLVTCQDEGRHAEGVELLKSLPIYGACFLADGR